MKKFLLSLCVLAVAGVCVLMTSCKDDDELATRVNTNIASVIAAAQDAGYTYTYVLNGQTYTSLGAVQDAINDFPAGTTNEIYVVATPNDGGQPKQGEAATFTTPQPGGSTTFTVDVPGDTTKPVTVTLNTTLESQHSGGAAKA